MSLQRRVLWRVFGLLSLLIVAVCVTVAVFSIREHRDIAKNSFRAQALFVADQVERLVLWDDRVALKALLTRLTDEQSVVTYAFVEKAKAPYVDTFKAGVPRALLQVHAGARGVSLKAWESAAGKVFYDIAAPLEQSEAVLHIGLARDEIDIESLPKVWTIVLLGGGALIIGFVLSGITATVTTREFNEMTDALRLSEERVRLLLISAAEGVYGIDLAGRCTFINPAALRMLGFTSENDVIGKNMHDLVHHSHADGSPFPSRFCQLQESARYGRSIHSDEDLLWRQDGSPFPAELWSHPVEKDGEFVGAVVTFVDISERKDAERERDRLQQQLFEAQKMEALGQLAGGVAHDFNNLLSPIILIVEVLLDDLDPASEEAKRLGDVLTAARRARKLVHQILSYSRPQEAEQVPIDLADLANDVIGLLRPSLPANVSLECRIDANPPPVVGDSAEIHQLILNLATNALQAVEATGGRIEVGLRRVHAARATMLARGILPAGDYVVLEVADSGCGMDAATREHIFEPFFTTKRGREGAGLGLAIVDRIVTGHGGYISVESETGKGTTFSVYLRQGDDPAAGTHVLSAASA
ncbi:MAG: PAS domain S-box protein [Hyphomicrobiales bacterium]|nr:PAS domain S-box protein [Hyphomicrobiales bacterium]